MNTQDAKEMGGVGILMLRPVVLPDGRKPFPLVIDGENNEQLQGDRLIGFQAGDVQTVVLHIEEFRTAPQLAVGLVPVLARADGGGLYALPPEIETVGE